MNKIIANKMFCKISLNYVSVFHEKQRTYFNQPGLDVPPSERVWN